MLKADVTMQSLGMQSHFARSGLRLGLRGAILGKANRSQEGDKQNARRALSKGHTLFPQKVDVGRIFYKVRVRQVASYCPTRMNNFSGLTPVSRVGDAGFGTSAVIAEAVRATSVTPSMAA